MGNFGLLRSALQPPIPSFGFTATSFCWDWLSDSAHLWGTLRFFQPDFTRLNGASPGPMDAWLLAHLCSHCSLQHSFYFCFLPFPLFVLHFSSVSGQRLIRPNPWQCLARATGLVAAVLLHCGVCVSVEALGRRWDAANVIVYLPFLFQMVLRRKNRIPDMLRPYRTLFPQSACSLYSSHGSVWSGDLVSGPECAAWGAAIAKNAQWDFKENTWKSGGCSWLCGKSWCENICAFRL